jgi:hypothetical protein
VPFGSLINYTPHAFEGVIPEKPFCLVLPMGIPSLNVYGRISAQDKHISTLDGSNCASRHDTQCAIVKSEGWGHCGVKLIKVCFKGKFAAKFEITAENVESLFNGTCQTTNLHRPPIDNRRREIDW